MIKVSKKRKRNPKPKPVWIQGEVLNEATGLLEHVKYKVKR